MHRRRPCSRSGRASASVVLGVGLALVTLAGARPARAEGRAAECVAATERGQSKRDEGKLRDSRAEFAACADDSCPTVVRRECVRWLAEVDERIPSLVVSVQDGDGKDVIDAAISLDGVTIPAASAGRVLTLDPGAHLLRVTSRALPPAEEHVLVRERERGRVIKIVLGPRVAKGSPELVPRRRTVPLLSWVLGGVAVAGAAGFAYFWASGTSRVSDLRASCAPYCTKDQIDDARTPLTVARIAGGIGIAAAVAAVTVYLLQPTRGSQSARRSPLASPLALEF